MKKTKIIFIVILVLLLLIVSFIFRFNIFVSIKMHTDKVVIKPGDGFSLFIELKNISKVTVLIPRIISYNQDLFFFTLGKRLKLENSIEAIDSERSIIVTNPELSLKFLKPNESFEIQIPCRFISREQDGHLFRNIECGYFLFSLPPSNKLYVFSHFTLKKSQQKWIDTIEKNSKEKKVKSPMRDVITIANVYSNILSFSIKE